MKARKRERLRCWKSLVDWPDYPRLKGIMQGSECARNSAARVAAARFFWMLANGAATASQQTSAAVGKALARPLYRLVVAEAFVGES